MPEVVSVSSAILPLAQSEAVGTTAREPVGFTGGMTQFQKPAMPTRNVLNPLRLDSGLPAAISPATRRGISSRRLFLREVKGSLPDRAKIESITTGQKAGPDLSEAGIEHEGIKRCSQSSKPAAGNTASFRMMCSR